jgi:N utilization substance protein A
MAHARNEFALALNQICDERNITPESVIETIKIAVLAAFRKEQQANKTPVEIEKYVSEVNPETGETRIYEKKEDESRGVDVTPPGFGRIAAQTAKQVILQKIREAEKESILTDYSTKIGGLVNGLIVRFDRSNVIVDIGKSEAVMPPPEQVYAEHYRINQRLVFYLAGIKETPKGNIIIVSRVHRGLIEGLFKREIPEVQNQTVKIKDVVREPGMRTKVAVWTDKSGVDPIGACVGQKGVRVQAILKELGTSERIDLVLFSEDVAEYIRSALAPAKNLTITLDEAAKTARVTAPEDQLSLAIGAKGGNVGLAARLTGYKIDIESVESENIEKEEKSTSAVTEDKKKKKKVKEKQKIDENEKTKKPKKKTPKKTKKTKKSEK